MISSTRRWSDDNTHFGPFTYSRDSYCKYSIALNSGYAESPGCHLRVSIGTRTLIVELPPIIRPSRQWVDLQNELWTSSPGYWAESVNEYSLTIANGALHTRYGAQTGNSSTDKSKCYFLPWTQWTFHRISLYDLEGKHFWTQLASERKPGLTGYRAQHEAEEVCPSASFSFLDFDQEAIVARTYIEERKWHFGTGWFRWLRWFRPAKVIRSLEIRFSKETGPKKGSWKGGTVGHVIEMLPGELHEAAFRRYCTEHQMTFVNQAPRSFASRSPLVSP